MSFTERIETLGKNLGGAALAPFKLVWDIGSAPFNDEEEFNGVANVLKTSFGNLGKSVARPIGDILSGIDAVNRTFVREPLTTLLLTGWQTSPLGEGKEDVGKFFDYDVWKKSWEARDEVSFGQALSANIFGNKVFRDVFTEEGTPSLFNEFDIFNKEQRDQIFKESMFGKLSSGSFDFAVQILGDLTIVGGKAVKVARAGEYGINALNNNAELILKAIDDIKEAQVGIGTGIDVNKYSRTLKDFTDNGVDYALARDLVKSSDDPDTLAYLLGKSTDENQTALVLRMALGDKEALLQFEKLRPSQAYAFKNSTGQPTATQNALITPDPLPVGSRPAVIDEVKREFDDLAANDVYFQKFIGLGRNAQGEIINKPILSRTVGTNRVQGFEDFLAKGRISKFYDKPVGQATEDIYQPTPMHRAYKKITWAADERPGGMVDLNDSQSYQEFSASLTRALANLGPAKYDDKGKLISGMSGDEATKFIEDFAAAAGPEQRALVVFNLERETVKKAAQMYKIDSNKVDEIYKLYTDSRSTSLSQFKELNFGIAEDGQVFKVPILESQTMNMLPIMDFDVLFKSLKRNERIINAPFDFGSGLIDFAMVLNDLFKAGTLLRLGYTMRNAFEAQLRITAAFGPLTALRFLPEGIKNFVENSGPRGKRMIDNVKSLRAGENRFKKARRLKEELNAFGPEIRKTREALESVNKKIDDFNKGPEIPPLTVEDIDIDLNDIDAIKFGNEDTLKRIVDKEYDKAFNNPLTRKQAEEQWKQTLPGGDQVNNIEKLITNKADLGRFRKTGLFPAYALRKFWKKDKYGNPVKLRKDDPLSNYSIEDVQSILFPDLQDIGRVELGPGEIEQAITNFTRSGKGGIEISWYPSEAKKLEFIDDYARNEANQITAQSLKEYVNSVEQRHTAKYLNNWPKSDIDLIADKEQIQAKLDSITEKFDEINGEITRLEEVTKVKTIGQGQVTIPSKFNPENYSVDDAFGSRNAEIYRQKVSNKSTYENVAASNPKYIARRVENEGYGVVTPDEIYYYEEWSRVLNTQFGNSKVVKFFLNQYQKNGRDWVKAQKETQGWLASSTEGRRLRTKLSPQAFQKGADLEGLPGLGLSQGEVADYVAGVSNMVRRYIPETADNALIERIAKNGVVTPSEMRSWYPDPNVNPSIHGRIISENLSNNIGQTINNGINKAFQALGTLPEDTWARYPLYISIYRKELTERFALMENLKGAGLTSAEQELAMKAAHDFALREVNKTLFTVIRRSNVGGSTAVRLMSPFFSAQENAIKAWARIIGNNPVIINRAQLLWTAPNRAGLVTDQEGNEIPPENLGNTGVIWIEVPKSLQKLTGFSSLTEMGIPKRSLDVVLGGGFEVPIGPYVGIPASEIVKRKPELEQSLKWALPFGPERNAVQALLPAWVKRQITRAQGQNSPEYARAYQLIWTTEQHKARANGQPYLSASEIQKKVDAYYNMRTVANLVLPFAPRFDTPYRMYMDKWREYQRTFGKEADEQFLEKFGEEFFDFAMSLSQNVGGVQASVDAVKSIKANKDLVADLYSTEPSLIGLVVNNPTGYDFSQAAYEWEYATPVAPGTKQTFRGTADPVEVAQRNQARLGWIQYRQFMSTEIEPVLMARGLSSLRDRRARDLRGLRDEMITKLANENVAWYDDYLDTDGSKTNRVIRGLTRILNDESFMQINADNPTWKSVGAYLVLRNQVAKELEKRKTKTLGAKANIELAKAFDAAIGRLKQDDIGFSDLYDRFLSQDKVYDKYIGNE